MKGISILLLCFMVLPVAVSARTQIESDNVVETQKVKRKRYFFTKTLDDLKIQGKVNHIPANNKVIVPYFRVTFATGGKYLNAVGGITTSKTKIYSSLNGVDPQLMQKITDQMYYDLLAQLTEAGYEVLSLSALEDNSTYQQLQESTDYPLIKKTNSMFTPGKRYFPGAVSVKAMMLARDVDALMLKADYTVNFISLNANEQKFNLLKDKSDVEVGQGINVFGQLSVITEKGAVDFIIQQPISSEIAFGKLEDATTAMNKVSDGVALVGNILGGKIGNRQSTSTVEITADPDRYLEATTDALKKSNATLASFMAASINGEELESE